jgi:hypothetical protein
VNKELSTIWLHSLHSLDLFSSIVIGLGVWPEIIRPESLWDLIVALPSAFTGLLTTVACGNGAAHRGGTRILSQRMHTGVRRPAGGRGGGRGTCYCRSGVMVREWSSPVSPLGFPASIALRKWQRVSWEI